MKEIRIVLRRPAPLYELYPRYDKGADLLEVGSVKSRDWPFGIDIDGNLIFDIDENRIIANFDLLIRKSLWKVSSILQPPKANKRACIEVSQEAINHKSFNLPLEVTTNETKSIVCIMFGRIETNGTWIVLSRQCLAYVVKDYLKGFFIIDV